MALKALEAAAAFNPAPYDASAAWSVRRCTDDDMFIDDLLGETPESICMHTGSVEHAGDLTLDDGDEYGFYVIDGDVKIDGILHIKIWDLYNPVVITGNLTAKALVVEAEAHIYVLGTTKLAGPLVADLGDSGYCGLLGGFEATAVLELNDDQMVVLGEHEAPQLEIAERYTIDETDDPVATVLGDLRAGKPLT